MKEQSKTITAADLRAAFVRWEQDYREGKTLSHEEADQQSVEDKASASSDFIWSMLEG